MWLSIQNLKDTKLGLADLMWLWSSSSESRPTPASTINEVEISTENSDLRSYDFKCNSQGKCFKN